jgi:two-component sensor histidine kinase
MANLLRESISCSRMNGKINITAKRVGNKKDLMLVIKDNGFGVFSRRPIDAAVDHDRMISPLMLGLEAMQELVEPFGALKVGRVVGQGKR